MERVRSEARVSLVARPRQVAQQPLRLVIARDVRTQRAHELGYVRRDFSAHDFRRRSPERPQAQEGNSRRGKEPVLALVAYLLTVGIMPRAIHFDSQHGQICSTGYNHDVYARAQVVPEVILVDQFFQTVVAHDALQRAIREHQVVRAQLHHDLVDAELALAVEYLLDGGGTGAGFRRPENANGIDSGPSAPCTIKPPISMSETRAYRER